MNTNSYSLKGVRFSIITIFLLLAVGYASITHAAQGCGEGLHRNGYGGCVLNHPGPNSHPAPDHPGCWRNAWGQLRC